MKSFFSVFIFLFIFSATDMFGQTITPTYDQPAFRKLMNEKLEYMQKIHAAMARDKYDEVAELLSGLSEVAQSATWKMIRTDGYFRDSSRFQAALQDLSDSAKRRNSQEMILPYLRLTSACLECHIHVRSRIR